MNGQAFKVEVLQRLETLEGEALAVSDPAEARRKGHPSACPTYYIRFVPDRPCLSPEEATWEK